MLKLQDYEAGAFQTLSPFFSARDGLEQFKPLVKQIGDVICAHQLEKYVGISLLHKHFDIADDELVLREFCDNTAYMKPKKTCSVASSIPYLWRVSTGSAGKGYYPLEFVDLPNQFRARAIEENDVIQRSAEFLDDFAAKLDELQMVDVFGLAASHSRLPFVIDEGMTLLETSDEANRILTLQPSAQSLAQADTDSTQTLWLFAQQSGGLSPFVKADCVSHCITHCHSHCMKHGGQLIPFIEGTV
jgi:hypothetical protein